MISHIWITFRGPKHVIIHVHVWGLCFLSWTRVEIWIENAGRTLLPSLRTREDLPQNSWPLQQHPTANTLHYLRTSCRISNPAKSMPGRNTMKMLFFSLSFSSLPSLYLCLFIWRQFYTNGRISGTAHAATGSRREQSGAMTICGLPLSQTPPFEGPAQSAFYFAPPSVFGPSLLSDDREFI